MTHSLPFTPLAKRIDGLPLVLAGPIVRRVQPDRVTVWVAIRRAAHVVLQVFDAHSVKRLEGTRQTVDIGDHLHIVAVTAHADTPLERGSVYTYDMCFDTGDGDSRGLARPGIVAESEAAANTLLCYPNGPDRPSFVIPSPTIEDLHIVHGSCRRPYLGGEDALPGLDAIIGASIDQPAGRPQIMFFTGDCIYADSNYTPVIFTDMIGEAADALFGWRENLPGVGRCSADIPLAEYRSIRSEYMGHTEPQHYQLFSLAEFLTMYLYMLSDVIWPDDMPCDGPMTTLGQLRGGMPRVRRSLANISIYAVFDDHEVSDDWNLTLDWCDRVYSRPLGRRVVQNGLTAFALVHAWGNTPELFAERDYPPPGARLLAQLRDWRPVEVCGDEGAPGERALWALLGVPDCPDALRRDGGPPRLTSEQGALTWHFRITAPDYEILALDLRTQRAFPHRSPIAAPEMLSDEALVDQVPAVVDLQSGPESVGEPALTLVIAAIPLIDMHKTRLARLREFLYYWSAGALSWIRRVGSPRSHLMYRLDLGDYWGGDSASFRGILARLAPRRRVVFLSGDLHLSYAVRVHYARDGVCAVFAQMTSSGMFNEKAMNDRYHRYGYNQPWPLTGLPKIQRRRLGEADCTVEYVRSDRREKPGRDVVGRNNLASITCTRTGDHTDDHINVHQHTYWRERDGDELAPHSTFSVAMDERP